MQIPKYFYYRVKTDRKGLTVEIEDASDVDVAEVVRCWECKWIQNNMMPDSYLPKGVPEWECRHWCGATDPTDFCSRGERKGGDE